MKAPKIYTKKGDQGETCLVSGESVPKSHIRLESYGTLDELNSHLGLALSFTTDSKASASFQKSIGEILFKIQNDLFNLGSQLACVDPDLAKKLPNISEKDILQMESKIDELTEELPPLTNFILPSGSKASSAFHICRTVCRRAERICIKLRAESEVPAFSVQYLNRLSDLLFVIARYANKLESLPEVQWKKM